MFLSLFGNFFKVISLLENMKKSNDKFLKPNFWKVVIAVVFFGILIFVPIMPCKTGSLIPNPNYEWGVCPANPLFFYVMMPVGVTVDYLGIGDVGVILALIISLAISYLLGCLLVLLSSKIKKK